MISSLCHRLFGAIDSFEKQKPFPRRRYAGIKLPVLSGTQGLKEDVGTEQLYLHICPPSGQTIFFGLVEL